MIGMIEGFLMKTKMQKLITTTCLVTLLGLFASAQAVAQASIARTPDGKPDLSGIWQAMTSAHHDIEPHAAAVGPHTGLFGALSAKPAGLGIVDGGRIPYNEPARRQADTNRASALENDPMAACYMPGVPRANYMPFPFQIVQSQNVILIAYEVAESNRILYVDQPEIESQVDAWMGHSNAHWEGDTLVVSVSGQMKETWCWLLTDGTRIRASTRASGYPSKTRLKTQLRHHPAPLGSLRLTIGRQPPVRAPFPGSRCTLRTGR